MFTELDYLMKKEQYEDMVRQSLLERQERRETAYLRRMNDTIFCRVLRQLGKLLVAWGKELQERYSIPASAQTLQTSHNPR